MKKAAIVKPVIQSVYQKTAKLAATKVENHAQVMAAKKIPVRVWALAKVQKETKKAAVNNSYLPIYKNHHSKNKYYGKIIAQLEAEIGKVDVTDRTIQRLINEKLKPGFLKEEYNKKQLTKTQYEFSKKILESKQWPMIQKLWS